MWQGRLSTFADGDKCAMVILGIFIKSLILSFDIQKQKCEFCAQMYQLIIYNLQSQKSGFGALRPMQGRTMDAMTDLNGNIGKAY